MNSEEITGLIAHEMKVRLNQVQAAMDLLDAGNTIPFIARYRKEATGELDEEQLRTVEERMNYLRRLVARQEEVLSSIESQGKLTEELAKKIQQTTKLQDLEDLYLPYRPKKRTRAQIAREKGLEPLAQLLLEQADTRPALELASLYLNEEQEILTPEDALKGAQDIIAEVVTEEADLRSKIREKLLQNSQIHTEFAVSEAEGQPYLMYQDYREPLKTLAPHRILAINRGEREKVLKVTLEAPHELYIQQLVSAKLKPQSAYAAVLTDAITDGYKRLLFPALEREIRASLTEAAEKQAIRVFGLNLKPLLLQPPLSGYTVLGLDPGFRTGCKAAVVDPTGKVLATSTLYITHSDRQKEEALQKILGWIKEFNITLISIGNGTASYETEEFVAQAIQAHHLSVHYVITNEAGASVYSASKLAKEELPDLDVSIRGAVSIARRIQDPLAELVKIDPKSIGVGQYQHDVNQKELAQTLTSVVESGVNHVGVELNTASPELLKYVSGISAAVAKNIVAHRSEIGTFKSRKELLKVSRLGPAAFTQCAGFLRIQQGTHPFDNTPVHPESYDLAEQILHELGFTPDSLRHKDELAKLQAAIAQASSAELAKKLQAGEPTVRDILAALAKPGRDPREDLPKPLTRKNVVTLSDITPGSILTGTVQNVTDFGAFIDIGLKVKGLAHKSQLSNRRFRHPVDIVNVGDIVRCVVLEVDEKRGRIALSLKQVPAE